MKKLMLLFSLCAFSVSAALAQDQSYYTGDDSTITVKTQTAPPALPDYVQPPCPEDGYLWTPGHWAWSDAGYYWVPGVWVLPPAANLVWTPGYWTFYKGYYGWHHGYWAEHIGYYGGINYGFGYTGFTFFGGQWKNDAFYYNTAVWNVNPSVVHHTFDGKEVANKEEGHRASFNGPGGVRYHPMLSEEAALRQKRTEMTKLQVTHNEDAEHNKHQFVSNNGGKPAYHSMNKPGGQKYDEHGNVTNGKGREVKELNKGKK